MNPMQRTPITAVLAALALAGAAAAAPMTLTIDPAASQVGFDLDATGHDVHGTFAVASGTVVFDPATKRASGEVVVDARSGETGNGSRDRTMHEEVLQSERFPTFVFVPDRIDGELPTSGSGEMVLTGELSVHGGKHRISLPAKVTVDGNRVEGTASFDVPYQAWGMEDPSVLILRVDDTVRVHVKAVGTVSPGGEAR